MPSFVTIHKGWALSLFCLFSAACSRQLAPEGHYQQTPVTADGNPGDWSLPLRFSNAGYTLQYNVTNDDKNLYIAVSSADDNTQLRMLRSGMTIYFDPKGKKNKEISLHYPIQKQPDPNPIATAAAKQYDVLPNRPKQAKRSKRQRGQQKYAERRVAIAIRLFQYDWFFGHRKRSVRTQ